MTTDFFDDAFSRWYNQRFGSMPEAQDDDNRDTLRKLWNEVLEVAAERFEFYDFEEYSGTQVAKTLRRMMVGENLC